MSDSQPPGLSLREQQVFHLVREGRMDSEIAVRLGVGTDEVRQTVAVLISKCEVSDRAGLRDWEAKPVSSGSRNPFDALADRLGATAGGIALLAIVLGAFVLVVWRALSGDDEPTDLSGLNTPTPSPSAIPSVVEQFKPPTYEDPQPFPAGTTMWVVSLHRRWPASRRGCHPVHAPSTHPRVKLPVRGSLGYAVEPE